MLANTQASVGAGGIPARFHPACCESGSNSSIHNSGTRSWRYASERTDYNNLVTRTGHRLAVATQWQLSGRIDTSFVVEMYDIDLFDAPQSVIDDEECDMLRLFVEAGEAVFGVEYTGDADTVCSITNELNFDWLLKSKNLDAARQSCR